jgi:hypothetical protein
MSKRRFTARTATTNLDPAAAAQEKMYQRLRDAARRTLLKRRRAKSGQ